MAFNVVFAGGSSFNVQLNGPERFDAQLSETITKTIGDYYDGDYEFTPGDEPQTVPISGLIATRDITINPVPSGYGKITWNGAYLTVS